MSKLAGHQTARAVIEVAGTGPVRQVMHDVLEADRKPDGQLRQDNVFRYVLAGYARGPMKNKHAALVAAFTGMRFGPEHAFSAVDYFAWVG